MNWFNIDNLNLQSTLFSTRSMLSRHNAKIQNNKKNEQIETKEENIKETQEVYKE